MLSQETQTRIAIETGQAPSNPMMDNKVIAEKYPVLGNALETAQHAGIQLKTITSTWNSETIDMISESLEKACTSESELEIMIKHLELTK